MIRQEREQRQERLQEMETAMCLELGEEPTFSLGLIAAMQQNPHYLVKEEQLLEYRQEVSIFNLIIYLFMHFTIPHVGTNVGTQA